MQRTEKVALVERLNRYFQETPHAVVTTFRGLSVNAANDLRSRVRSAGGHYQVVKNRLARRALVGTDAEPLAEHLTGPCAVAGHPSDPVALAKALAEFAKDNPQVELVAGVVDGRQVLDVAGVKELATMPSLPELQAKLLALLNTPGTMLLRLVNTPGSQLAQVMQARADQLGEGA